MAPKTPPRLALVLANGAYTSRAKLSKPVAAAVELRSKLSQMGFEVHGEDDQDLIGMQQATQRFLKALQSVVEQLRAEDGVEGNAAAAPTTIFIAFCGHGAAGRFLPIHHPVKGSVTEDSFSFFDDLLFQLYRTLGVAVSRNKAGTWPPFVPKQSRSFEAAEGLSPFHFSPARSKSRSVEDFGGYAIEVPISADIIAVIDTCRRLSHAQQQEFEAQRLRVAQGRRHLLPSFAALRPDLMQFDGAAWDAASLDFLNHFGPQTPQLLLGLSSESTTPSYDAVFLRSITEAIDRPVRLGGILERASLDTQRRTGYKQKPVLLWFGSDKQSSVFASHSAAPVVWLHDRVLKQQELEKSPLRGSCRKSVSAGTAENQVTRPASLPALV
mmetsp:Transcript_54422/g.129697  ORF Transcript_54422/g.129697 Transcript_54422/m.129697 type:complete len:383 (-) Transcript_54422:76-1224(-)